MCGWIPIGTSGRHELMTELKSIRCPCGFEVRSRDEGEIVRTAQLHTRTIHGQEITEEQARALIQLVA